MNDGTFFVYIINMNKFHIIYQMRYTLNNGHSRKGRNIGEDYMDKSELRQKAVSTLKQIHTADKKALEQQMLNHLVHSKTWKNAHTIGITISKGFEWETKAIIEKA